MAAGLLALCVIGDVNRTCLAATVKPSISGLRVFLALERIVALQGYPCSMACDANTEFMSNAMPKQQAVWGVCGSAQSFATLVDVNGWEG